MTITCRCGHVYHLTRSSLEYSACESSLHITCNTRLACRVLIGMDTFWQFFQGFLEAVPVDLGADNSKLRANELGNPKRLTINEPTPAGSTCSAARA